MQPSTCLVRPDPYSTRATTTSSHPQLRDLLTFTPDSSSPFSEGGNSNTAVTVCYDSLCSIDLWSRRPPDYTPLKFTPAVVTSGLGLVAAGGQSSEIALKSAQAGSDWCHQYLPATSNPSSSGVRTLHTGSINNSIHISPSPVSLSTPRLLVSNNDEKIAVYDVAGHLPNYQAGQRRRARKRREGWSVVEASWAVERGQVCSPSRRYAEQSDSEEDDGEEPEEQPTYDPTSACHLVPLPHLDIPLSTAVNHCSMSPDGKNLVAVGDTNEVFLFDCRASGYELAHVFEGSRDASFSTDWSRDGVTFAVASQDGFVHVYDLRSLPTGLSPSSATSISSSNPPRKLAELKTTQSGPAGAARKVAFSPRGGTRLESGLMAFTEHRNRLHIIDARTFESYQVLDVPIPPPSPLHHSFPSPSLLPLRPRPHPPPRPNPSQSRRALSRPALSRLNSTASAGSGTRTPRDETEREELEAEMRERSERRMREEERRLRMEARRERARAMEDERARRRAGADEGEGAGGAEEEESEEEEEGDEAESSGEEYEYGVHAAAGAEPHRYSIEEEEDDDEEEEEERDEDERMASVGETTTTSRLRASWDASSSSDDSDSESAPSSVNTTRPRRFGPTLGAVPSFPTPAPRSASANAAAAATLDPPPAIHRNFVGYAPLHPNPSASSSSPSSYPWNSTTALFTLHVPSPSTSGSRPQTAFSAAATAAATRMPGAPAAGGGGSYYYSSYLPVSAASSSSAPLPPPPQIPRIMSLFAAPLFASSPSSSSLPHSRPPPQGASYYASSAFFPLDTSPADLLGLSWDEWGERVLVATGERVWEWDVDTGGRRGSGGWGVR